MAVYIDHPYNWGWAYGRSCHLIADTIEELHEFAEKIGLRRYWYQTGKDGTKPHYDLTMNRRHKALALGAIELNRTQFVEKLREIRQGVK